MSWLERLRDAAKRGVVRPEAEGGTVFRRGRVPAATSAAGGARFGANQDVGEDLIVRSLLGVGAMGEVYLAQQRQWDVDVALKVPNDEILADPDNRHRIIREAEAWTDLGLHPNIAYCYYAQPLDNLLLLLIEYVDGGNLRDWIGLGRCADLRTGLDLANQFCHGLEHAHEKGLVHRDIKPENILLMQNGTLKITDFGIVRKALVSPLDLESMGAIGRASLGMTVVGIGTPFYMSPEQWGDQSKIDSRADIFSFGICLYEMMCGARPYQVTVGQRQEAPEPGRLRGGKGLPERLCRLMKGCVNWDRDRRPAGFREVLAELCAVFEAEFGEACVHATLPGLTTQADDCNNRALSYLALGRVEDAEKAWHLALDADPQHPESTYNYGLHRWRGSKTTDQQVLVSLGAVAESSPSAWLAHYLMANIHLERGDVVGARQELALIQGDDVARAEVKAARRAVERLRESSGLVRVLARGARTSIASISADGRWLVEGSGDWVKFRKTKSRRWLRTLEGHTGYVKSVSLSSDNRLALSGSSDKTLRLWDVGKGQCLHVCEGHTKEIVSVCASPDGRFALSGGRDETIRVWETGSGSCLHTFQGHKGSVDCVCLSADGRLALSGGFDTTLRLWEVSSGRCLRTFEGHASSVSSVCLSVDGARALSGSHDGTMRLWDITSGRCLRTFEGRMGDDVRSVCLSVDGSSAMSADGVGKLWQIGTFRNRASFRLARLSASAESLAAGARHLAALAEARRAAATGDAAQQCRSVRRARRELQYRRNPPAVWEWAKLYSMLRRRALTDCWLRWRSENGHVKFVCPLMDGRSAASNDGLSIKLWEVENGHYLRSVPSDMDSDYVDSLCLSADGRLALTGSYGSINVWEVATGHCLRRWEGHSGEVNLVGLSADGHYALSGGRDKRLKLWDVASGRCLRTFEGRSVACLSADGRYVLSGGEGNGLSLWDGASGFSGRTFEGHTGPVNSVCLSADGRLALSGSWDQTVKLWDVASASCLRTFQGHAGNVESVCLSADGRWVLSGSTDSTAKLWDVKDGHCVRTLVHASWVTTVALSPDAQHAITSCYRGPAISTWFLDWELEENEPADWDEGARRYLDNFLRIHQPYAAALSEDRDPTDEEVTQALTRRGRPEWSEDDFKMLLYTLAASATVGSAPRECVASWSE